MRDRDRTLVFVEVRARGDGRFGGAAASIGAAKRQRLVFAASHHLRGMASRRRAASTSWRQTDDRIERLRAAFGAGSAPELEA